MGTIYPEFNHKISVSFSVLFRLVMITEHHLYILYYFVYKSCTSSAIVMFRCLYTINNIDIVNALKHLSLSIHICIY